MREIKFRVWDGSRFYYFDMFTDKGNFTLSYNDVSGWNVNSEPSKPQDKWLCGDSSDTPMQMDEFTGLKDKNGTEIYEGDVVFIPGGYGGDYHFNECKGDIKYESPEFYIDAPTLKDYVWDGVEVIGNIHENPELLNEKT